MHMKSWAASKRRVSRCLRELAEYPIESLIELEQQRLATYETRRKQGNAVGALTYVQSFAMSTPRNLGFHHVLSGSPVEGWRSLERSWFVEALSTWAMGPPAASDAAELLTHAMIVGDEEVAAWMANLTEGRLGKDADRADDWKGLPYPRFALGLYRRWLGRGTFENVDGVYARVAEAWNSEAFGEALDAACEYHLEQAMDEQSVRNDFRAYSIAPVELVAIRLVREREGLRMPEVSHPLAHTPLAQMPIGPTGYDPTSDPWVQRAIDVAKPAGLLPNDWEPARSR